MITQVLTNNKLSYQKFWQASNVEVHNIKRSFFDIAKLLNCFGLKQAQLSKNSSYVGLGTTLFGLLLVLDSIKSCTLMSAELLISNLVLQGIQTASGLS